MTIRINSLYILLIAVLACSACANHGSGPQGGPIDTIPPALIKETPLNGTLHFEAKRIDILFNEYIQLADIQKNVMISPPQLNPPDIKAIGKTLSVVFNEDLQDSTTYTIDFGAAICDYNERTPLNGYIYSFSTGDLIDTFAVSGRIYDAENLNPMPDVIIGIHSNHTDSAFSTMPFARITRSDEEGYFTIHNIREGSYRLYALNDISRDYMYQPGEALAFADSLILPYFEKREVQDTIWRDTLGIDPDTKDTLFTQQVDTIQTVTQTFFLPDSLVLWYFKEDKQRHYFKGVYREEQHAFTLIFSAPQDTLPVIRSMKPSEMDTLATDSAWIDWMPYTLLQSNATFDTITCWLTDSVAIAQDSIYMVMTYLQSDSLYNLAPKTDTISAIYRHPRMSEKARAAVQRQKQERTLELKTNSSSQFEIYDTIRIFSPFPIDSVQINHIHLSHKKDTLQQPIQFQLHSNDSLSQTLMLIANMEPAESYMLTLDSAALVDIYGKCNDSTTYIFKLKSLDAYSSLMIKMAHFDAHARIQILNDKDQVVRELPASQEGTKFDFLSPTTYYIRMYIDYNGDTHWTTGDWLKKRQPEPVYYFPSKLKLRANWDFEETFDHLAIPQTKSKPRALISNNKQNR
ncbi:MAG: Ig-like domain-containing protein [Paludibacteraceae bacterium]|nr:Ig-like domain-containing protein [Paludibacteraceae bacterium]